MALYYTDQTRNFATRHGIGYARAEMTFANVIAVTTAMIDNIDDEVGLFFVPPGFTVTSATISATDMDTNAAPTLAFDVGDDTVESRIFAASTVGQAGTLSNAMARTGHLYQYTAETLIKAYVQAVAATGAAGTLRVSITGFVDPGYAAGTALTASTTA
jgi:hypothetical protein